MSSDSSDSPVSETDVTVRFWASARAAAGVSSLSVPVSGPVSVAALTERIVAEHPGSRLGDVLKACSVLLGDQPLGTRDPASVLVPPGTTVEYLPPFAGG